MPTKSSHEQTNRQTDRQTNKQTDRQTDRETDKQTHRETNTVTNKYDDASKNNTSPAVVCGILTFRIQRQLQCHIE